MMTDMSLKFKTLISLLILASPVLAQDEPAEVAAEGTLEEVTVTATRRGETDILTTPVSITALSGEDVERFEVRDLNEVKDVQIDWIERADGN